MGTATSARQGDALAGKLDREIGQGFKLDFGKFMRKVVQDVPLTNLRELSSGDLPSGRAETVTVAVPLESLRETLSGDIPRQTETLFVPLSSLREITVAGETADVLTDVDFGGTADKGFGLLGDGTTPKLMAETGEGGQDELEWASGNTDPVILSVSLPDIDTTQDITVTFRAKSGGTEAQVFDLDSYFNEGDTKVPDASAALSSSIADVDATIDNGDIPSGARTLGIEITPGDHGANAMSLYEIRIKYTKTATTSGAAGLLDKSTTPAFEVVNGDTDGNLRVSWAATEQDPVTFKVSLPNIDTSQNITVTLRAIMGASSDNPVFDLDSYIEVGSGTSSKISDASGTVDTLARNIDATIAAADIGSGARTLTVELTPAAHGADALHLLEVRVTYTSTSALGSGGVLDKGTTPILEAVNGDTDGRLRLRWVLADQDPVGFQIGLRDIDTDEDIVVILRGLMSGSSNTPVIDADSYLSSTKVEDASSAFGTTETDETIVIASADIPTAAEYLSVELTPGSHGTDAMYLYSVTVVWTRKFPMDNL